MTDAAATILVTGGAGYVGGATTDALLDAGYKVIILDDFSAGFQETIPNTASFRTGSYGDSLRMERLFQGAPIDVVLHCGAKSIVSESAKNPDLYFNTNVQWSLNLLNTVCNAGVKAFVFSSSAAVYGTPPPAYISEDLPLAPINPYGATKVSFELALRSYAAAHDLRAIALRYFNVAGSTDRIRERHDPETHLVPRLLHAAQSGEPFELYGADYGTPDGTALRDYVHLADVAAANVAAVKYLLKDSTTPGFNAVNIGSGVGTSVKEAIGAVERATKTTLKIELKPRRAGDPPRLVADISRASTLLGWKPRQSEITRIVRSILG
ncbi:MAG: UDP-glucose 4-epimerase GalE [Chloroflexota bacterium]|jgi:nucleoside-diphosphate-sugar epimerase